MTEEKSVVLKKDKGKMLSKIERAGEQVMIHLTELTKNTDLSFNAMAQKMNEVYGLELTKKDVSRFFKKNSEIAAEFSEDASLSELRAKLYIDANKAMVKDIKLYDSEIGKLVEDGELLEPDKRAKAIGDLLDKKGRLLLRHARLSGKLGDAGRGNSIGKMQVNIFQQVDEKKSEIIEQLKKVEFEKEEAIDVKANEVKETNSN